MNLLPSFNSSKKSVGLYDIYAEHILTTHIIPESLYQCGIALVIYADDIDYVFINIVVASNAIAFKCTFVVGLSTLFFVVRKLLSFCGLHFVVK